QIGLGWLSDRIGREWVWTVGSVGFIVCYATLLKLADSPTMALVYVMVVAQGMLGYGLTSVIGSLPAELVQSRHYGSSFGMPKRSWIGGGALGPWLTGVLHDHTGTYTLAFWIAIASSVVSAGAIWLAAPRKVRAVAGRLQRIQ